MKDQSSSATVWMVTSLRADGSHGWTSHFHTETEARNWFRHVTTYWGQPALLHAS